MSIDNPRATYVAELPRALESHPGHVDPVLLGKILGVVPRSSKVIRAVINSLSSTPLSSKDNAMERMVELIADKRFLTKWETFPKGSFPTFTFCLKNFLKLKDPNLAVDSEKLRGFFDTRNGKKKYPILERIDLLVEVVRGSPDRRVAALFLWTLNDGCISGYAEDPSEECLYDFWPRLNEALESSGEVELLELIQTPNWHVDSKPAANPIPKPSIGLNSPAKKTQEVSPPQISVFFCEFSSLLKKVEIEIGRYETANKSLVSRVALLQKDKDPIASLAGISDAVNDARSAFNHAITHAETLEKHLDSSLSERLNVLGATLLNPIKIEARIIELNRWTKEITDWGQKVEVLLPRLDSIISKKQPSESHQRLYEFQCISDFNEFDSFCDNLDKLQSIIHKGEEALSLVNKRVRENISDLSWSAFGDKSIADSSWVSIGRLLIQREELSVKLAIMVHNHFNDLHFEFSELLQKKIVSSNKDDIIKLLDMLSWLSLGQIEHIAEKQHDLKVLLAVAELDAYFKSLALGVDGFVCWSSSPLRDVISGQSNNLSETFFRQIYKASGGLGFHALTPDQILLLAATARVQSAQIKDRAASNEALVANLADILSFRRKGGKTTYAHIWREAYEDTFSHLARSLESGDVDAFLKIYNTWMSSFDIEEHLDKWKSEIPEHLKKNSEYNKFIRNQISLKTHEIDAWIKLYKSSGDGSPDFADSDAISKLKKTLGELLKGHDSESKIIQAWLEAAARPRSQQNNNYVMYQRSQEPCNTLEMNLPKNNPFLPRVFTHGLDGQSSYDHLFTDVLIYDFGFNTSTQLAELYESKDLLEAYASLANELNEELPPALDRKIEKKVEDLTSRQGSRLLALSRLCDGLGETESVSIIVKLQEYLDNHEWNIFEKEFSEAEQYILELEREKEQVNRRLITIKKIVSLGGVLERDDLDEHSLINILNDLEAEFLPRRAHIEVLKKLQSISSIDKELATAVDSCIRTLEQADPLPSADASESAAFYLNQAITPLAKEMARSHTLLPSYARQLNLLALSLVYNIQRAADLFSDNSLLLSLLVETDEIWQQISERGKEGVDLILSEFRKRGLAITVQAPAPTVDIAVRTEVVNAASVTPERDIQPLLIDMSRKAVVGVKLSGPSSDMPSLINSRNWIGTANLALNILAKSNYTSREAVETWAIATLLNDSAAFGIPQYAAVMSLFRKGSELPIVKHILSDKVSKAYLTSLSQGFIQLFAGALAPDAVIAPVYDSLQKIVLLIDVARKFEREFSDVFSAGSGFESLATRALWESFTGDSRQAEARSLFMYLAWMLHAPKTLANCLVSQPIDIEQRKAKALANAADVALKNGIPDLIQGFLDLKQSIPSKPFQLFVEMIQKQPVGQSDLPAILSVTSGLQRRSDGQLFAVIRLSPRKSDSPDRLVITLPPTAPIRFPGALTALTLDGPFLSEISIVQEFLLLDERAEIFSVEIQCVATSLKGIKSKFDQRLDFTIDGSEEFNPLTSDEIEEAFDYFPAQQMRGPRYVPRIADERKIEKALFSSRTVRSLWISSPRRSGKTTMLFRILDEFSHKANRDSLVVYLTLDESISDITMFNKWVWKRIRTLNPNKELRELYPDFELIGRDLPYDSDAGTFLCYISDRLLKGHSEASRIIFLIDEIDRFASMYFDSDEKKKVATDILWQIRLAISDRRDVGVVFAGSSAAKQVFISNAESPFYNSIDHMELTPFSCKTDLLEAHSRQIVEPARVKSRHMMPKEALEHLIWICAGIPYYMKLVAGATFAVAKQSHILKGDVNDGLRALLARQTGIPKLDDMGGEPGSDDLRTTITLQRSFEGIVAQAVLYAFADIHSPVSGHRTYRGKLASKESKLVYKYFLTKPVIERGIDICIGLGLIRLIENDSAPEIDFVIPILGETLRKSSGRLWATIDHELSNHAIEGA
ncbi:ATP-binding protein [Pseudomonas helleri]|uniref:Uncharacterized protein n=1 Tax=Pseudomonas helleri TaxID=1608996 RepID=A0A7X1WX13_9PSED|nr:hypothetical protein [Pseudomonas helleri]MQT76174.1 hypothetical protein [Pseudomonas helleri]